MKIHYQRFVGQFNQPISNYQRQLTYPLYGAIVGGYYRKHDYSLVSNVKLHSWIASFRANSCIQIRAFPLNW